MADASSDAFCGGTSQPFSPWRTISRQPGTSVATIARACGRLEQRFRQSLTIEGRQADNICHAQYVCHVLATAPVFDLAGARVGLDLFACDNSWVGRIRRADKSKSGVDPFRLQQGSGLHELKDALGGDEARGKDDEGHNRPEHQDLVEATLLALFGLSILSAIRSLTRAIQPYAYATFASVAAVAASSYGMWQIWFMALVGFCVVLFSLGRSVSTS